MGDLGCGDDVNWAEVVDAAIENTVLGPQPVSKDLVNPDYYLAGTTYEAWNCMEAWAGRDHFFHYLRLTAMKYLMRLTNKGDTKDAVLDLRKTINFANKMISMLEADQQQVGG